MEHLQVSRDIADIKKDQQTIKYSESLLPYPLHKQARKGFRPPSAM